MNLIVIQKIVAMSSTLENKILNLQERLRAENESRDRDRQSNEVGPGTGLQSSSTGTVSSPASRREFNFNISHVHLCTFFLSLFQCVSNAFTFFATCRIGYVDHHNLFC